MQGTASERLRGYKQALRAAKLRYDAGLVVSVPHYEREDGKVAMEQLLARPERPDAVFCFNDLMAIGALRACVEAGVRVPRDVAIVGFDNIVETQYSNPTITTIAPDLTDLSRQALTLLLRRIDGDTGPLDGDTGPPREDSVRWKLVERETTVGPPRRSRRRPARRPA